MDLGLKTVGSSAHTSLLRRLKIMPGQHGQKGKRKTSEYGIQLREKQKAKRMYGLLEKQFRNYFQKASKKLGNTGEALIVNLERRLDNTLYRLGFAPTRASARQFVSHGHVLVDNQSVNIPSYEVKPGQIISFKPKILEIPLLKQLLEDKSTNLPAWLERKGPVGKVAKLPVRGDVQEDINEQLIIEFYSR
ncbi:MAG: 30S ribosomal protein S4 [Candidatus Gottesmanbacteria bacterium GW2011_GWA2_41_12]|uniref:Small ribosomal subunit protein uS4 n=1 Tax=Candidatus Gottesmanbacteria bacterium GW2011_GWA2_41_12 TaxID=1618440 RepID=A0A0G0ULT5_9BACT|nr:MAG: 30S ribosomal protein S4 [Candidatus Gottesmanbacteria bacterium GW2011_GWA2_41_12]